MTDEELKAIVAANATAISDLRASLVSQTQSMIELKLSVANLTASMQTQNETWVKYREEARKDDLEWRKRTLDLAGESAKTERMIQNVQVIVAELARTVDAFIQSFNRGNGHG